jgi:hypothetical protein
MKPDEAEMLKAKRRIRELEEKNEILKESLGQLC